MKGQMIRQKGFSKKLLNTLKDSKNKNLSALSEDDVNEFITHFWRVLANCLRKGIYVSFEGWISFFTRPIQRNCRNTHTSESWLTFKKRLRTKFLDTFRDTSEIELTKEEYLILTEKNKK
jgi:nucleoid DNA-binding protein